MYMTTLPNSPANKDIFQIQSLFCIKIRVEAYKTSGPSQCHACQGFGHSSLHCGHTARCVKCGEQHFTKDCTKTPDLPPKCCNCGGEHTANYRKCPAFFSEMARLSQSRKPTTKTQPPPVPLSQQISTLCDQNSGITTTQIARILSMPLNQMIPNSSESIMDSHPKYLQVTHFLTQVASFTTQSQKPNSSLPN